MDKKTILLTLLQLEQLRIGIQKGDRKSTADDFSIRVCEAEIASNFFTNRNEWTEILKKEYGLIY